MGLAKCYREGDLRVQLINSPVLLNPGALTALRPAPPLGLAYVAAALRQSGQDVSVIDAVGEAPEQLVPAGRQLRLGLSDPQIVSRIDPRAEAIGISNMWSFGWPTVRTMIRAIRRARPDLPIVCGGEHFSATPEHSMNEAPIDFIVRGEGEEVAVELFRRLGTDKGFDRSSVPGICWRGPSGAVAVNAPASRTRNIDDIPWPAWDLFPLSAYDQNRYVTGNRYGRTVPILATRGCPYQCTFCSSPGMWTTRWYARDPADVVDEIEHYVHSYGANHFPFQDLTAIIKKRWIVQFCGELLERKLDIRWQLAAGTRCEVIDEEVVSLLARSGCRALYYAPESGSEQVRAEIKKEVDSDALLEAARIAVDAGLNLGAFLVIGFPKDKEQDLEATVELAGTLGRMGLSDVSCAYFFPIPGTALYEYLLGKGRVRMDDDFLMTPLFVHDKFLLEAHNYCENVSARRLTYYKYRIVSAFYSSLWRHHPRRAARTLRNLLADEEGSKLDVFLNETKRRLLRTLGVDTKPKETIFEPSQASLEQLPPKVRRRLGIDGSPLRLSVKPAGRLRVLSTS